VTLQSAL